MEAPLPRAAASGAPIALVCGYQVDEKQIAFTIGWYDAQAEASSIVVHARGPLDLDLDEVIFSALDEILDKVRDRVQALSAGRLRVVAGPSLPASRDRTVVVLPDQGGNAVQRPASSTPLPAPFAKRLLLSGGFAPFLPTGAASYYFGVGYLPSLLASFIVATPVGPMGIGAYVGMDYFSATGVGESSVNYLMPLGLDL